MELIKKRKLDENGLTTTTTTAATAAAVDQTLTLPEARKLFEPFTAEQLIDILSTATVTHSDVLSAVRAVADRDVTLRKLFVRGLGWETTSDSLQSVFEVFGEIEEAVVILDKVTSKSKGYGFVTYRHIDGAILALKQPSKLIDGRVAMSALASAGLSGGPGGPAGNNIGDGDTSLRKLYVGNVAQNMAPERLLDVFSTFGEIEEGPLGFDKVTGKAKGFALFVYKTPEGAQSALAEPIKFVDGMQLICKLANDGKKGKPGFGRGSGEPTGMPPPSRPVAGLGYSSFSGYSGMGQHLNNTMNPSYNSSVGGQGLGGHGGSAGYGYGAEYGGGGPRYGGGANSGGYGGYGCAGNGYEGPGTGGAGGGGYGMPPNSGGVPGGGYSDGGQYGLSSGGYPSQQPYPAGTSPAPRVPPGAAGGYSNPPPYYRGVHAIDSVIEAATTIVTPLISASSCPTNSSAASSVDDSDTTDDARPKTCRRLPDSISFSNGEAGLTQNPGSYGLTPSRTNSSFRQANVTLKYPPMNFGGRVVYCRTIEEVEEATLQILKLLEAKKCELGRAILGLDLEWKPSFNKGIPQGIAAVMQICGDMTHCYVLHIFHSGIPQSLKYLLEDSSSVKVGVGIGNDAVKLFHDYNVSIKSVQDLSILANQKLGVAPKQWSLSSLVETLTCKQLLKPKRIRLGNWEVDVLSKRQLQYAATDAFASWYLYEVLMSFPDPPDGQMES